jgi:hypothetical protein
VETILEKLGRWPTFYMTIEEAAELLVFHEQRSYKAARKSRLPVIRVLRSERLLVQVSMKVESEEEGLVGIWMEECFFLTAFMELTGTGSQGSFLLASGQETFEDYAECALFAPVAGPPEREYLLARAHRNASSKG